MKDENKFGILNLDRIVSGAEFHRSILVKSFQFYNWLKDMDPRFNLEDIDIQSVNMNHHKGTMRFATVDVHFTNHKQVSQTNEIFMRGASIVMFPVLICEGSKYTILAKQPRLATGIYSFPELPAETMEGNESFMSRAVKGIEEELGIKIRHEELIDLTQIVYRDKFKGVYTSPGACDEYLRIVLWSKEVSPEVLKSFMNKETGLREEGEDIILEVIKLSDLPFRAPDAKSLSALMLYNTALEMKVLS